MFMTKWIFFYGQIKIIDAYMKNPEAVNQARSVKEIAEESLSNVGDLKNLFLEAQQKAVDALPEKNIIPKAFLRKSILELKDTAPGKTGKVQKASNEVLENWANDTVLEGR